MKHLLISVLHILALCLILSCGGDVPESYSPDVPTIELTDTTSVQTPVYNTAPGNKTHYITSDGVNFYEKEVTFKKEHDRLIVSGIDVEITLHDSGETYFYSDPFTAAVKRVAVKETDSYWQVEKVKFFYTLPAKSAVPSSKPKTKGKK